MLLLNSPIALLRTSTVAHLTNRTSQQNHICAIALNRSSRCSLRGPRCDLLSRISVAAAARRASLTGAERRHVRRRGRGDTASTAAAKGRTAGSTPEQSPPARSDRSRLLVPPSNWRGLSAGIRVAVLWDHNLRNSQHFKPMTNRPNGPMPFQVRRSEREARTEGEDNQHTGSA